MKDLSEINYFNCPECGHKIWRSGNTAFYKCPNCSCHFQVRELTKEEKDDILTSTGCGLGYEWWKEE